MPEYGKDGQNMKKKLANNLSLKIISVLIACVIWILVSGTIDPVRTNVRYSGIKVEVKNDGYIYDAGKSYQIADEYQTGNGLCDREKNQWLREERILRWRRI